MSAVARPHAALVFDQMAKEYDEVFTRSMIGRTQRNAVWSVATEVFPRGSHVLELNCGTGEDALFLARNGVSVTACDASPEMVDVASSRWRNEAPNARISFNLLPTERLRVPNPETFDPTRRPYQYMHFGYGLHTCFGLYINMALLPLMLKPVLQRRNLQRIQVPDGRDPNCLHACLGYLSNAGNATHRKWKQKVLCLMRLNDE